MNQVLRILRDGRPVQRRLTIPEGLTAHHSYFDRTPYVESERTAEGDPRAHGERAAYPSSLGSRPTRTGRRRLALAAGDDATMDFALVLKPIEERLLVTKVLFQLRLAKLPEPGAVSR